MALPGEYDRTICAAAAMGLVATITEATCLCELTRPQLTLNSPSILAAITMLVDSMKVDRHSCLHTE